MNKDKKLQEQLEEEFDKILSVEKTPKFNTPIILSKEGIREFYNRNSDIFLNKSRAISIRRIRPFKLVRRKNSWSEGLLVFVEECKAIKFIEDVNFSKKSVRFKSEKSAQSFARRVLGEVRDLRGIPDSKSEFKVVFIKDNPMALSSWVYYPSDKNIEI